MVPPLVNRNHGVSALLREATQRLVRAEKHPEGCKPKRHNRVGRPLVRYFEAAAISATGPVKDILAFGGRFLAALGSPHEDLTWVI
jgi:hypothetical protein